MNIVNSVSTKDLEDLDARLFQKKATLSSAIKEPRNMETQKIMAELKCQFYPDASMPITIEGFPFQKKYFYHRALRGNKELLQDLGIYNPDVDEYYECFDPLSSHVTYRKGSTLSEIERNLFKKATIFPYHVLNPKGELLSASLRSKEGLPNQNVYITSNNAAMSSGIHMIFFAQNDGDRAIRQVYHEGFLFWIDDLMFNQLGSTKYRGFFNNTGAGHSMHTWHGQILTDSFPIFVWLNEKKLFKKSGVIETSKRDWALPGYYIRYLPNEKNQILCDSEAIIKDWIANPAHTFNLLFQLNENCCREMFIVPRHKELRYIQPNGVNDKISIAGLESAGILIIESWKTFYEFPKDTEEFILIA